MAPPPSTVPSSEELAHVATRLGHDAQWLTSGLQQRQEQDNAREAAQKQAETRAIEAEKQNDDMRGLIARFREDTKEFDLPHQQRSRKRRRRSPEEQPEDLQQAAFNSSDSNDVAAFRKREEDIRSREEAVQKREQALAKEDKRLAKENERQAKKSEQQAKESERRIKEKERQAKEDERLAMEEERQAKGKETFVKEQEALAKDIEALSEREKDYKKKKGALDQARKKLDADIVRADSLLEDVEETRRLARLRSQQEDNAKTIAPSAPVTSQLRNRNQQGLRRRF